MDNLKKLRENIDAIDEEILLLLKKRFDHVQEIAKFKTQNKLPLIDEKRKKELIELRINLGKKIKISEKFIEKLFSLIHDYSVEIQKKS